MALPLLQSYNDPKIQKAYRRYMKGESQRQIAAAIDVPARTLARYCKNDGWEAERQGRAVAAESPEVAAVAAGSSKVAAGAAKTDPAAATNDAPESRMVGMERMLARQQRIVSKLLAAYEVDVEKTLADAEKTGKTITRSQIHQLTTLGNNLLTMERKAWCVPDKIETKDTTPAAEDKVRKLKDDELDARLKAAYAARLEAERRTGTAAARGGSEAAGIN